MVSSVYFKNHMAECLDSLPVDIQRRGKGIYRISQCGKQEGAITCSIFRQQISSLLDLLDAGESPIVIVRRPGMRVSEVFYVVEKLQVDRCSMGGGSVPKVERSVIIAESAK